MTSDDILLLFDNEIKGRRKGDFLYRDNTIVGTSFSKSYKGEIIINEGVQFIAAHVFEGYSCTSIQLPNSLLAIGKESFYNCKIKELNFPKGLLFVAENAFYFSEIESVTLGNSMEIISRETFSNCYNLKNVNFGDNVKFIQERAFEECTELKSIVFPKSLKSIADSAFSGCINLETIIFHSSEVNITYNAFYGCDNLQKIVTPEKTYTSLDDFLDDLEIRSKQTNSHLPINLSEESKQSYAFRLYELRKEHASNEDVMNMIE